ncbi:hypothetical protein L332_08335 [Agrococcus pavilionensis RW1]|uniref:Uncharacterized protein n=1 Tax=Agrococcus pavilionensis RW1 TaxID=1330458 RepID=U1MR96_9MICO|nr:hypothetical protein [Agrococcus pavilionensis]ERG64456.1 hypothetical protein L332_08335 [Agrococcus pavilionensis RW1]
MNEGSLSSRAALPIGGRIVAAIAVHLLAALVLERTASPGVSDLLRVPLPSGGGPAEALAGWALPSAAPLAVWALLVVGRAWVLQRGYSAFWFVGAALLVAAATFPIVLLQALVTGSREAVATALAAWLIPPCAATVAAMARVTRGARDDRSSPQ